MDNLQLYGLLLDEAELAILATAVSSYIAREKVKDNAMLLLITELMNDKAHEVEDFDEVCESLLDKVNDLAQML